MYVIMLPGMGTTLEILPVFARKTIFGYRLVIYSTLVAGVLSFVVWAHHVFISDMDPRLAMPFSITTILIAVPFAIDVRPHAQRGPGQAPLLADVHLLQGEWS